MGFNHRSKGRYSCQTPGGYGIRIFWSSVFHEEFWIPSPAASWQTNIAICPPIEKREINIKLSRFVWQRGTPKSPGWSSCVHMTQARGRSPMFMHIHIISLIFHKTPIGYPLRDENNGHPIIALCQSPMVHASALDVYTHRHSGMFPVNPVSSLYLYQLTIALVKSH